MGGNFPEDERAHETIISGTKLCRMKQLEERSHLFECLYYLADIYCNFRSISSLVHAYKNATKFSLFSLYFSIDFIFLF